MALSLSPPLPGVKLPVLVQLMQVVAAAYMLPVDENLGHCGASARALRHGGPPVPVGSHIELRELNIFLTQQRLCPVAVGAIIRRIDFNACHGSLLQKRQFSQYG